VNKQKTGQAGAEKKHASFSAKLTTMAFDHSSLRWLEINT
jgi:hypothetical protein